MRPWLFLVFFIGTTHTFAQEPGEGRLLTSRNFITRDTLTKDSFYFIKNDTLTRFKIGKLQALDHCSSYSIIREVYKKEHTLYRQFSTKTIKLYSTCTSLVSDRVYCLRLIQFKLRKETVTLTMVDSDEKKLKVRLTVKDDFETRLKNKLDAFVTRVECNVIKVE